MYLNHTHTHTHTHTHSHIYIHIYICVCACVCMWGLNTLGVLFKVFIFLRLEKKVDANYTRMLREILNKSWRQHPTRHQLYGHLSPITKTVRRTRHAKDWWRSRDELISDVLQWIPHIWPGKSRTTSSNINGASMWEYGM